MQIHAVKSNVCFQSSSKLLVYSLASWGLSSLMTLLLLLLDTTPLLPPDSVWRPGVGTLECFITRLTCDMICHDKNFRDVIFNSSGPARLLYFHGPVLLLVTGNLVLYIKTADTLRRKEEDNHEDYYNLVS